MVRGSGEVRGRLGTVRAMYWMKQTLKLLKTRVLLLIPSIISDTNWLWVGYHFYKILVSFVYMGGGASLD